MVSLSERGESIVLWLREAPSLLTVGAFFVAWVILWLPLAIPGAIALKWRPPQPPTNAQKLPLLACLYAIAPFLVWGMTRLTNIDPRSYGLVWRPQLIVSLLYGLILGLLGLLLLFGLQTFWGWVEWQRPAETADAALPVREPGTDTQSPPPVGTIVLSIFVLGLWIGGTEELVFRGFLLTELQQDYGATLAAIVSSAIFALLHLVWEWRETLPQLPGLWLMGMVLVLARWADAGNLGLAWGLHAGWVLGIAAIDSMQLIHYTGRCPDWVTGLGGKPLAGIMGSALLLATGALLWYVTQMA